MGAMARGRRDFEEKKGGGEDVQSANGEYGTQRHLPTHTDL